MLTRAVAEWLGNAAAVVSGVWGAVTQRSEHSGYSRTAIYTHAQRVVQAVANEQSTGLSYEALWAEHERLRAENRALMNSLLGRAGFPPLDFPPATTTQPMNRVRRRSWHQIQAQHELGREEKS